MLLSVKPSQFITMNVAISDVGIENEAITVPCCDRVTV